jgi:alginate O-acetyltransferase complex protein AlgI
MNYAFGLLLDKNTAPGKQKKWLVFGVLANLSLLFFFKYANFILDNINIILQAVGIAPVEYPPTHLPIGISFFTFQALSYLIDVYKNETIVQRNVFSLGLYIASFPQLIAGPIVRYHDVAKQIRQRSHSFANFSEGIERFIWGLSKKVLIANSMGAMADAVFTLEPTELSTGTAWLGIICYTLQIYFDFSGYSDMAIGLGKMFGFHFLENFNYPYISRSIQEFWRRWHISLSNWFRDYLYIPLGGNRLGDKRTAANLIIVFLLCGLWHGASWNFIIWGLIYGVFLVAERGKFGSVLRRLPSWIQHVYVLLIVINAWVFFRVETLDGVSNYFSALYGNVNSFSIYPMIAIKLDLPFLISLIVGILISCPLFPNLRDRVHLLGKQHPPIETAALTLKLGLLAGLTLLCVGQLAIGSYNPFIYFRF